MASARTDPLRSTLDNLQLDPASAADRPYLVAMLRRLGYTEREIDEVVRTGRMPEGLAAAPVVATRTNDGSAPGRDYRLVVPARETRFALEGTALGTDAPFEALERVQFEDPNEYVEFEEVTGEPEYQVPGEPTAEELAAYEAANPPAEPTWQDDAVQQQADDAAAQDAAAQERESARLDELAAAEARRDAEAREAGFDSAPIDQFGDPDASHAGAARTRVRVRRVRAGSREEAERKVAGKGRTVIKSVPVDIVERWGQASKPREGDKGGQV